MVVRLLFPAPLIIGRRAVAGTSGAVRSPCCPSVEERTQLDRPVPVAPPDLVQGALGCLPSRPVLEADLLRRRPRRDPRDRDPEQTDPGAGGAAGDGLRAERAGRRGDRGGGGHLPEQGLRAGGGGGGGDAD